LILWHRRALLDIHQTVPGFPGLLDGKCRPKSHSNCSRISDAEYLLLTRRELNEMKELVEESAEEK
jgi:hypothetical protein